MIGYLTIDLRDRTIWAFDENNTPIVQPGSPTGGPEIKFTKVSAGGLIIQALVKMMENREGRV